MSSLGIWTFFVTFHLRKFNWPKNCEQVIFIKFKLHPGYFLSSYCACL